MIPLSASGLERVEHCPASVVLPQMPHTGEDALAGTHNHVEAETTTPEKLRHLVAGLTDVERETSYVLDTHKRTSNLTGHNREYGERGPDTVGVTLDVAGRLPNNIWRVIDWKTRKRVTHARDNIQLVCQALAIFYAHNAFEVEVAIGYLDNGEVDRHTWSLYDIPAMWDRVRRIVQRAKDAQPDQVHSGPWCDYCPALVSCPRQRALATSFGMPEDLESMSPEKVGELYAILGPLEKRIDQAKKLVNNYARSRPVPLPDGKELALVECTRSNVDGKGAIARLEEHGLFTGDLRGTTTFTQLRVRNRKET